jgi:hypothetical protein
MDALMSQFDRFGRAISADVETHEIDLYAGEEAQSAALAERADCLELLIARTPMKDLRRETLRRTLRAIRLDSAASEKLSRLEEEIVSPTLLGAELPLDQQMTVALAAVGRLVSHPELSIGDRVPVATLYRDLMSILAPALATNQKERTC